MRSFLPATSPVTWLAVLTAVLIAVPIGAGTGCDKKSTSSGDEQPATATVENRVAQTPGPAGERMAEPDNGAAAPSPHGDKTPVQTRPSGGSSPSSPSAPSSSVAGNAAAKYGPVSTKVSRPPGDLAGAFALERIAKGFKRPVAIEHAPGDSRKRLFVVEQHIARIRIMTPGSNGYEIAKKPFFSLEGKVSRGNEQGLLGLAFHPKFAKNRRLFVYYTDRDGTTRVIEYRTGAGDPDRVDMTTAREIFALEQPFSNHNAGDLEFGPDGKLYVGTGDGGAANDPLRAGQDKKSLLAKMLRFDVDGKKDGPVKPEMVQLGLRNPWRYSFDAKTGDLYIGDVGQNLYEFVYVVAGDDIEGHNFGWNITEGDQCFGRRRCDKSKFTPVAVEYDRKVGCSITGGEVYRGKALPELDGVYFYADYCQPMIRSFRWAKDGVRQHWDWRRALDPKKRVREISSFGHDADGELFVVSLAGPIYKLVRKAP